MRLIMNNSNSTTRTVHKNWGTYKSISMLDSIYRSLAWGGLDSTSIFELQTGRCDILAINIVARNKYLNTAFTPFTQPNQPPCNTTYQITAENLKLRNVCD